MIDPAYESLKQTLLVLLPELLILATATVMMTAGAFVRLPRRAWSITAAAALVVATVALIALRHQVTDPYRAVVLNDAFSGYARLGVLLTGLILLGLSYDQVDEARAAEFFGSLLLIHAGAMLVCAANELVLLFAGLELVSIPTYLLLYLPRRTTTTQEAATKYFFLSIFSSALLLYGMAYLYGLTGVSNLKALSYLVHARPGLSGIPSVPVGLIAVVFMMAGLGFRVAAVPFHFYAPDVYQGSPTVIAAMLAWVPKVVGFAAMIRALTAVLGGEGALPDKAVMLTWVIAAATMTLGNALALLQDNLRRLLAYSSIAHAGYLLIGVAAAFRNEQATVADFLGAEGVMFYLAAYALMTLGAFGVIVALSTPERPVETVDDFAGLFWTNPWPALAMGLCLFSLAGVPPLAGFWGKFWVFAAALSAGGEDARRLFQVLAVIGVLNAAIGAYYYLRIVVVMMYPRPGAEPLRPRAGWPTVAAVGTCASLSLLLGLYARPIAAASRASAVAAIVLPEPPAEAVAAVPAPAAPTR